MLCLSMVGKNNSEMQTDEIPEEPIVINSNSVPVS